MLLRSSHFSVGNGVFTSTFTMFKTLSTETSKYLNSTDDQNVDIRKDIFRHANFDFHQIF